MATNIRTVKTYDLDGSTREFDIPFEYLARKFVVVTLIGIDRKVLVLNTDYRFSTKTLISTTKAWGPADGYQLIEIRRFTSATDRLVDFTDGSILRAYDLNVSQIQTLHVAEEARDLTADTIGVNNDGDLDARGRRIVNLALAVDDTDAITYGQVKNMGQGAYQSAQAAKVSETNAKASETKAKTSETNAKTSETNAKNSENAAKASQTAAATSETNAKTSEGVAVSSANAAKISETNSKTSEVNAKASENKAKEYADDVHANVASYGANPIGSVVLSPLGKALAGYLPMDGSKFNTATYPELFAYLGTDTLPDWRNRYVKMAETIDKVGLKGAWGLPALSGSTGNAGGHTHGITVASGGSHAHTGTAQSAGAHSHGIYVGSGSGGAYVINQAQHGSALATDRITSAGAHTHNLAINAGGAHAHSASAGAVADHAHSVSIPAQGSGTKDVDHVTAYYWIKAFGTTDAAQLAQVSEALEDIRVAVNTANDAKTTVDTFEDRVSVLESSDGDWRVMTDPLVLTYLSFPNVTPIAPTDIMVKINRNTIQVKGISRSPANYNGLFNVVKTLPGTTAVNAPFFDVLMSNLGHGYGAGQGVVSAFPYVVGVQPVANANSSIWFMFDCTLIFS